MIIVKPNIDSLEILNISDEQYFTEYSDYISNSRLSLINPDQGGSVEKYLAREKLNSPSLLLGSAVHAEVLQPGEFNIVGGIHRPTAKLGLMADELAKYYPGDITDEIIIKASDKIDYYKGKMNPQRITDVREKCSNYWAFRKDITGDNNIFLDDASYIKYKGCVKSVNDNADIQRLLHPEGLFEELSINNEVAFIIHFDVVNTETGELIDLPFKAKLDNFSFCDGEVVLNDLKTTGHLLQDFPGSFEKYHYYRQMAVYAWLLKLASNRYMNEPITSFTANMLVVSTVPEYNSQVFRVKRSDIIKGFEEFKSLLHRVADIYV